MAHVIQINDRHALAFGLNWQVLDPMESKAKQTRSFRADGAKWQASFKVDGEINFGSAKELRLPSKLKTLSGAGQAASHPEWKGKTVLILLEDQGHDGQPNEVAVIGLLKGNVLYDLLVPVEEVRTIRQSFFSDCERANTHPQTIGKSLTMDPVEMPFGWDDLLPKKKGRLSSTEMVAVTPLRADMPGWVVPSLVVTILAGAGYSYYQKEAEKAFRQRLASQKVDPMVLYEQSVNQLLAQPVAPAAETLQVLREKLKDIPTHVAGWQLASINCGSTGSCLVEWNRKDGTYKEFLEYAPKEFGGVNLMPEGVKLVHTMQFAFPQKPLPTRDQWPTEQNFILETVSQWQRYWDIDFKPTMKLPQLVGVPPSVPPAAVMGSPNAVWASNWDVRGAKWWMAEGLDTLPGNVALTNVVVSYAANEINFEAGGLAYVRK